MTFLKIFSKLSDINNIGKRPLKYLKGSIRERWENTMMKPIALAFAGLFVLSATTASAVTKRQLTEMNEAVTSVDEIVPHEGTMMAAYTDENFAVNQIFVPQYSETVEVEASSQSGMTAEQNAEYDSVILNGSEDN